LAVLLGACATTGSKNAITPRSVADSLIGVWDNAAQYSTAPDFLKKPPAAGRPYDWLDRQHAQFWRVDAPGIGADVIYLEWRSGGPAGEISRQRIWSFRRDGSGQIRMDFFTFKTPAPYAGQGGAAGAFTNLKAEDLVGYGESCGLRVAPTQNGAWDASIAREDCQITARSGRKMGIEARVTLMPTGLLYDEAGILETGDYAFKVPGGPPYDFRRP
jgi:hypothetical protein